MLGDHFLSQHIVRHEARTKTKKIEISRAGGRRGVFCLFDFLIVIRQVSWMKKRAAAWRHGWCWDKEWEVSTRTVGQIFVVDFLSFYYENIHTYLMDYCRDVMNTTIQITKGPC